MDNALSLFGITELANELNQQIEKASGEITDEIMQAEERIQELLTNKVDGCVIYRRLGYEDIEKIKLYIKDLQARVKSYENKMERFDQYILNCMAKLNVSELKGEYHTIKTRKPSKSVLIQDENKIPAEFVTVETVLKIDKKAIADRLKSGEEIEGACLVDGKIGLNIK